MTVARDGANQEIFVACIRFFAEGSYFLSAHGFYGPGLHRHATSLAFVFRHSIDSFALFRHSPEQSKFTCILNAQCVYKANAWLRERVYFEPLQGVYTHSCPCCTERLLRQWPYRALWTLKKCSIRSFSGARYPNAIVERRLWKECQVSLLVKLRSHRKNHVSITRKQQSALGHYKGTASLSSCKNYWHLKARNVFPSICSLIVMQSQN